MRGHSWLGLRYEVMRVILGRELRYEVMRVILGWALRYEVMRGHSWLGP